MADGDQTAPRNMHHPQFGFDHRVPHRIQHLVLHWDAANIWCLPAAPLLCSNAMINLQADLREASAQMAAKGLSFRLQAPTFVPLKRERPKRPREYWLEHSFQLPADKEPRPAWRYLPRPGYQLKDNLQYPCTATAIASMPTAPPSCTYCRWRERRTGG